ncbi:hypothetical protein BOTBODRAFT_106110 [Botryobasidium botryosum FD-172 SS1]|uniref:Uncharacterized protein n=1 Tax=Botryobasidium botryosum (strain FD-172 SS1) TaxID=930990 RepID=A0A067MMA1_BOTB1|nr:hypothetical protein BOTBODRAFT_106110 [Botryobasidium botryosum FD-172 SS1]
MKREHIRAVPLWRGEHLRHDCIFVEHDVMWLGMRGLGVARVQLFMSLSYNGVEYPCALVSWFSVAGDSPDEDTGMWIVTPDLDANGVQLSSVIHINYILRLAHLMPVFGDKFLPLDFHFSKTLDSFSHYFVNKL